MKFGFHFLFIQQEMSESESLYQAAMKAHDLREKEMEASIAKANEEGRIYWKKYEEAKERAIREGLKSIPDDPFFGDEEARKRHDDFLDQYLKMSEEDFSTFYVGIHEAMSVVTETPASVENETLATHGCIGEVIGIYATNGKEFVLARVVTIHDLGVFFSLYADLLKSATRIVVAATDQDHQKYKEKVEWIRFDFERNGMIEYVYGGSLIASVNHLEIMPQSSRVRTKGLCSNDPRHRKLAKPSIPETVF